MQMGYGLYQEQSMKLVMTPELRQAITILQFSALDLLDYINQQLSENPVIEPLDMEINRQTETKNTNDGTGDVDWSEYIRASSQGDYVGSNVRSHENEYNPLDWVVRNDHSLERHLSEQLSYIKELPEIIREVSKYIIGNLDEKGYLELALEQVAQTLNVDLEEVEQALWIVQSLEPRGVGARDLKECLIIQLEYAGEKDSLAFAIVEKYLTDLADGRISKIAGDLQVTPQDIQVAADFIRSLNPRPGSDYYRDEPRYIIPDVTVEKVEDEYIILVNDSTSPRLSISSHYERLLKQDENAKKYIHDKMNSALWLIKSIEQRRMTIYKVTEAIVKEQREFFEKGIAYLKPMNLKEIADIVDLHESTISRATNNKYVQTPRGVFELKYFFSSGLTTASGDATSSESVKAKLKQFIDQEDRKKPLSDQKLCELLNETGIEISRRTVAKYREELGILSSAKRKRY
ncbi:RNA polymerase factor sigma-54 [Ammoniphilus sp. CFH 90114]|uniref:RNA polymerase factor sigma-54 n=1 Tax=Ammoniphilus sp. CFH 90114 TaxID=2493665 RepID=UPI00100E52C7|nr:RNA polymerase factor sigma-54 [Ammoniphilus sp. CFH 90114]RXT04041.1 RNA polymerase sigma-54 factor [Ammoniphilus sp. CFH 90114]